MMRAAEAHRAPGRPLPPLRGRVQADAPLAPFTWFRVGGPAELLFRPADADDLVAFLRAPAAGVPVTVLGVGSNLIVRDGGVPGVVIRLGGGFGDDRGRSATASSPAPRRSTSTVAEHAAEAGLAGPRIPVAASRARSAARVAMNAGAYGAEIEDVLDWAEASTRRRACAG